MNMHTVDMACFCNSLYFAVAVFENHFLQQNRKVFMIQGPYPAIRQSLRERGWVEKFYRMTINTQPKKSPRAKKKQPVASDTDDDNSDDDDDSSDDDPNADDRQ